MAKMIRWKATFKNGLVGERIVEAPTEEEAMKVAYGEGLKTRGIYYNGNFPLDYLVKSVEPLAETN